MNIDAIHYKQEIKRLREERDQFKGLFEAANDYINETPCDPDITENQLAAWTKYNELVKNLKDADE